MSTLKGRLREHLHGFEAARVRKFCDFVAQMRLSVRLMPPALTRSERLRILREADRATKEFIDVLERCRDALSPASENSGGFSALTHWGGDAMELEDFVREPAGSEHPLPDRREESRLETWLAIEKFAGHLGVAIKEAGHARRGRKSINDDYLLTQVAEGYYRILGKMPTATRGSEFFRVAVELTGQRDPERAIRVAVARVRTQYGVESKNQTTKSAGK